MLLVIHVVVNLCWKYNKLFIKNNYRISFHIFYIIFYNVNAAGSILFLKVYKSMCLAICQGHTSEMAVFLVLHCLNVSKIYFDGTQ